MKSQLIPFFLMLCLALLSAGCRPKEPSPEAAVPAVKDGGGDASGDSGKKRPTLENKFELDFRGLERSIFQLGLDIQSELSGKQANPAVSPVSIYLALSMTMGGAQGETARQMEKALRLPQGVTSAEIPPLSLNLLRYYEDLDPAVALNIANSLWYGGHDSVKQPYRDFCRRYYEAEVREGIDPSAVNAWVAEKTGGRIPQILDSVTDDMSAVILNAVYFKGTWTMAFDRKRTLKRAFYAPGGPISIDMMHLQETVLPFYADEQGGFQAVALPYGEGKLSMYLFLPDDGSELSAFLNAFSAERWASVRSGLSREAVLVTVPKFKLEYEASLKKSLQHLGMKRAFEGSAEFGAMSDGALFISDVMHKTFVELNEEGTEAAAATGVVMVKSAPIERPPARTFTANRPFFYIIADERYGIPLFMGCFTAPQ